MDNCLIWHGRFSPQGYGVLVVDGAQWLAHRWAYQIRFGAIPEKRVVRHKCDNKRCVNPDHLELGTHKDNTRDMIERGRARWQRDPESFKRHIKRMVSLAPPLRGERNGRAKLTREQVETIRADPRQQRIIAMEYRVSKSLIHAIKAGKLWR